MALNRPSIQLSSKTLKKLKHSTSLENLLADYNSVHASNADLTKKLAQLEAVVHSSSTETKPVSAPADDSKWRSQIEDLQKQVSQLTDENKSLSKKSHHKHGDEKELEKSRQKAEELEKGNQLNN